MGRDRSRSRSRDRHRGRDRSRERRDYGRDDYRRRAGRSSSRDRAERAARLAQMAQSASARILPQGQGSAIPAIATYNQVGQHLLSLPHLASHRHATLLQLSSLEEIQRQAMLHSLPGINGGISMAAAAAAAAAAASSGAFASGGLPITPAAAAAALAPSAANKRAREIYIGNLPQGIIGSTEIRELFNLSLANFVPDPVTNPPVVEVKMDPTGRYAFVELRTFDLTHHILQLDKVEVAGKPLKIGRPKGYEEEVLKMEQMQKLAQAQSFAAQLSGGPTNIILMVNLMPARAMLNPQERRELFDDVYAEAVKIGPVAGVAVPVPGGEEDVDEHEPCRVYIKYHTVTDAKKCKEAMDGRAFDERTVKASFSNEIDFGRAHLGEWISEVPQIQFECLPGPPPL